jgi:hypothetical protein
MQQETGTRADLEFTLLYYCISCYFYTLDVMSSVLAFCIFITFLYAAMSS